MPDVAPCPGLHDLERFLVGELSEADADQMETHLVACRRCVTMLGQMQIEDRLVKAVRHAKPDAVNPTVARLMSRLSGMVPKPEAETGPPTMEVYSLLLGPAQQRGELGRLGHYRVLRIVGGGGMGVVFEGEDTTLQRRVALKVMKPAMTMDPVCRERFLREAQAAAAIEHPNVVSIFQVGEDRGVPYMAMQFLRGQTLAARLFHAGRLPIREVLCIGIEIASGLAAAHKRDMVHRDIKPGNIWLEADEGRVKILDFGLARVAHDDGHLTPQGAIVGTAEYMPPEQARGEMVDFRGDLYSFGCVLYEMATGRVPITGRDTTELLLALAVKEPPPAIEVNRDMPIELSALIQQMVAKDPADRPASAKAVADALAGISYHPTTEPEPAVPLPRRGEPDTEWHERRRSHPRRPRRRVPVKTIGLLAGLALVLLVLRPFGPRVPEGPPSPGATQPETQPIALPPDPPPQPLLPDRPRPFVVTRARDTNVVDFPDLPSAMIGLADGDVIDVHGNGPFPLNRVLVQDMGLHLRAAPGYRPLFVPGPEIAGEMPIKGFWLRTLKSSVRLEGCDFRNPHPDLVLLGDNGGGPVSGWDVHNCCLITVNSILAEMTGPHLRISDSLIVLGSGSWSFALGARTRLELTNNLIRIDTVQPLIGKSAPGGQTVYLRNNTLLTNGVWIVGGPLYKLPFQFEAEGNLIWQESPWRDAGPGGLKSRLQWRGGNNLYVGPDSLTITAPPQKALSSNLKEWRAYWDNQDEGSQEAAAVLFGWDRLAQRGMPGNLAEWTGQVRPLTARTREPVGPNWERVGPGDPYASFRTAQDPLGSRRLREPPPAEGAYLLMREGQLIRAYPDLPGAIAGARAGDAIEVRGDGPVPSVKAPGPEGSLTIRAAPGYRPVVASVEITSDCKLTVEGVHFAHDLPRGMKDLRLTNCSGGRINGDRHPLTEVTNCLLPFRLQTQLPPGGKLSVRNSLVGGLALTAAAGGQIRVELERALVVNADPGGLIQGLLGGGEVAITAQHTLFDSRQPSASSNGFLYSSGLGPALTHWTGKGNVYRLGPCLWQKNDREPITDLAGWRRRWTSDADSIAADPLYFDPRQWRLLPQSAGYQAAPGGKDFGADVSRVGRVVPPATP